ncbi:MAG: hypothetical protein NC080_07515 [Paraprevotella sp.]|nr:hypothetical protein [Paraprevotella sp.]
MITLSRDEREIIIGACPCSAHQEAELRGHVHRRLKVLPYDKDPNFNVVELPEYLPNGLYSIFVKTWNKKGMLLADSELKVKVEFCQPPAMPILHEATYPNMGETITECCKGDASNA